MLTDFLFWVMQILALPPLRTGITESSVWKESNKIIQQYLGFKIPQTKLEVLQFETQFDVKMCFVSTTS